VSLVVPIRPEKINKCLQYRCVVYHPTFFFKTEVFNKVGGYREEFIHAQDYDFLLRARSKNISIANQPDYLLDYRIESKSSFVKDFNQSRFARLAIELDRERNKFGSESEKTFSQVKKIEDISCYQYFVHKPFLNLISLANKLKGSKRYIIRIFSILIGILTREARSEIFRDLMYYQVLQKK
jgi:GT2 family glycosyltransferase